VLIAQISDLHIAEADNYMRKFVDANAKLAAAIDYLNAMQLRPDVVLATGDLTDHGRPEQYELLAAILAELDIPLLLIPGNHDERDPFRETFAATHPYLPQQGPIQYVVDDYDVRLIAVDTTRVDHHDGELDDDRLQWLDHTLAQRPDDPAVVFLHHPPFTTGIWWMDCVGLGGARQLEAIVRSHPNVQLVLAGHLHRPITTNWGSTVVSTAPSTTHQVVCNLHPDHLPAMAAEPPMLQLHWWTGDAFVSHTTVFEPPSASIEIASLVSDWEATKARMKQGPPFSKGGPFG
jgi:3',5'-cyclic AMP phosphodiesterase CpdA